jgi:beta-N-acetylhexosaminidase
VIGLLCLGALAAVTTWLMVASTGRKAGAVIPSHGPSPAGQIHTTPLTGARVAPTQAPAPVPPIRQPPPIELSHAIGAKIMTGMNGTYPSASLLSRVRAGQVGGVILMGANISNELPAAIAALQGAASAAGDPPLLIATDQEGGPIRRLPNAPPDEPAADMSGNTEPQGRATARALLDVGINTDLAPVADVAHTGDFLGARTFSASPTTVGAAACQFARGLNLGGVNATFKHFPGLGAAFTNTDLQLTVVSAGRDQLLSDLLPYRECQPQLVMVSNAIYPALGSQLPAVFSRGIVTGLLRDQLGFRGVTISDTLGAPCIASSDAAVRATNAGIDMLLYTDQTESALAYWELRDAVAEQRIPPTAILSSARRIYALTR